MSTGLYAYVRHPMYSGALLLLLAMPPYNPDCNLTTRLFRRKPIAAGQYELRKKRMTRKPPRMSPKMLAEDRDPNSQTRACRPGLCHVALFAVSCSTRLGLWILPVGVHGSCAAVRKASRAGTL